MTGLLEPHLPLLHVVGAVATHVTTVDGSVLAAALAVLAVAIIAIWVPGRPTRGHLYRRKFWRRVAHLVMGGMVFLAVLPTVLPVDHIFFHHDDHASAAEEAVHANHCHLSPGSCSDVPVTSGPGQFLLSEPLVVPPAMLATLIAIAAPLMVGISPIPLLRPPLRLAA